MNPASYRAYVKPFTVVHFSEHKPMPVSNYLEFGSELKIKIDLAYPLNAVHDTTPTDTKQIEEVRKISFHLHGGDFIDNTCQVAKCFISRTLYLCVDVSAGISRTKSGFK